jgi:hypothetical protein
LGGGRAGARGPYPVGGTARLYAELSLATGIPFDVLERQDDATIATLLELIDARNS